MKAIKVGRAAEKVKFYESTCVCLRWYWEMHGGNCRTGSTLLDKTYLTFYKLTIGHGKQMYTRTDDPIIISILFGFNFDCHSTAHTDKCILFSCRFYIYFAYIYLIKYSDVSTEVHHINFLLMSGFHKF